MKKFLSVFLALALMLCIGTTALADYVHESLHYVLENGSISIVGCTGDDETIVVPAIIAGNPVNTICSGAFTANTHLRTLYLPDIVTTIEEGAIPSGVTVIVYENSDSTLEFDSSMITAPEDKTEGSDNTPGSSETGAPAATEPEDKTDSGEKAPGINTYVLSEPQQSEEGSEDTVNDFFEDLPEESAAPEESPEPAAEPTPEPTATPEPPTEAVAEAPGAPAAEAAESTGFPTGAVVAAVLVLAAVVLVIWRKKKK